MYDAASIDPGAEASQVDGVGQVIVGGSALPAVRVEVNPTRAEQVRPRPRRGARRRSATPTPIAPKGQFSDATARLGSWTPPISSSKRSEYQPLIVAYRNGAAVRASRRGDVDRFGRGHRATPAMANGKPAVLVIIFRQPGANIIETVDRVRADAAAVCRPRFRRRSSCPWCMDRTTTIRASVHDVEFTLVISIVLVILVVFVFLRNVLGHPHSQRRRAAVADRHVRRDVPARLQPRQPLADGADHLDRLRGGRRDRGDREHHALSRAGHGAVRGGAARGAGRSASRCFR